MKSKVVLGRIAENILLFCAWFFLIPGIPSVISEKIAFAPMGYLSIACFIANRVLVFKRNADNLYIAILQILGFAVFAWMLYLRFLMG